MRYLLFVTVAAVAGASALAGAAAAPAPASRQASPRNSLKIQADAILDSAYRPDGPGAAAIVTRDGKVVYAAGRGLADIEAHRPITPATVFELGSIAKQFTAAVILQLAGEGRLSLDDPLSKFFPDWPQPGAKATLRQLLNHTSGIRDFSKVPGFIQKNSDRDVGTEELLALTKKLGSAAEPGTKWEYNNGGYVILGAIVEKVTGKSWYEAIDERIARPLGLKSLAYAVSGPTDRPVAKRYAIDDGKVTRTGAVNMSIAGAAGGLVASVEDMAKWSEALHGGKVVSPALYQEMIRPAKLADGSTAPYGLALHLRKIVGHRAFEHGGSGRGIDTDSAYLPEDKIFVAVFSNSDDLPVDSSVVMRRLGALAVGSPLPSFTEAKVEPASIEPLFGRYGAGDHEIRFFSRNGRYFIASGDDELRVLPAGGDRFFSASTGLDWVEFVRGKGGSPVMALHDASSTEPERLARLGALPAEVDFKVPPAILQTYAGEFQTETLPVTIRAADDGWLVMTPKGKDPVRWRPVATDEFRSEDNRMRLKFDRANGQSDSFTMYRGARELHGKRVPK
jgi:CubicO group peptidase (beta-lactamase class C family)